MTRKGPNEAVTYLKVQRLPSLFTKLHEREEEGRQQMPFTLESLIFHSLLQALVGISCLKLAYLTLRIWQVMELKSNR
jgi:hypothetical protein